MPLVTIPRNTAVLAIYRVSRVWKSSGSVPAGIGIAFSVTVFSVAITIADELLSAALTYQGVIGLSVDLILMAVPVSHATLVIAIFLFFATRILRNRLPTVMAKDKPLTGRMALQMGFDGVGRKTKFFRNPLIHEYVEIQKRYPAETPLIYCSDAKSNLMIPA